MAIRFACPSCRKQVAAPETFAGRKVRCRSCGQVIRVPGGGEAVSARSPDPPTIDGGLAGSVIPTAWDQPQQEPQYSCAVCGGRFAVGDVYDQHGTVICRDCHARQAAAVMSGVARDAEPRESGSTWSAGVCAGCGAELGDEQLEQSDGQRMCPTCAMSAAVASAGASASTGGTMRPAARQPTSYLAWVIGGAVAAAALLVVGIVAFNKNSAHPPAHPQLAADTTRQTRPTVGPTVVRPLPQQSAVDSEAVQPATAPAPSVAPAPPVDWEKANGPRLADLRQQAQSLVHDGNLQEAVAKYQAYLDLAKGAENPSSTLQDDVADVRNSWEALKSKLASQETASAGPTPSPEHAATSPAESSSPPPPGQPWDVVHHQQIQTLLAQAQARMDMNDKLKAAFFYQRLFNLLGGHLNDIHDAALRKKITDAVVIRSKLIAEVKTSPEAVSLTASTLLASGMEALDRQRWQAGLESMSDVRDLFDRNVKVADRLKNDEYLLALHGMAVAYLRIKQVPKAGELFDDSRPLGKAVDTHPTRALVINRAVVDITQHTKAARAAKTLKEYLEKHRDPPDETLINLFGTAINVGQQHGTVMAYLNQCAELYVQLNANLEKTRPGEKRWGVEWMPAAEADKKIETQHKEMASWQKLVGESKAAYAEWQRQLELFKPQGPQRIRYTTAANVAAAERNFHELAAAADAQRTKIPTPPWLTQLDPVLPVAPASTVQVAAANTAEPTPGRLTPAPDTASPPDSASPPGAAATDDHSQPPVAVAPPSEVVQPAAPARVAVQRHALAFAIDKSRLITAAGAVGDARSVRVTDSQGMSLAANVVAKTDELALLEVQPSEQEGGVFRYLNLAQHFSGGAVKCAAIPEENIFGPQPMLLGGSASAPENGPWMANLSDHPRLAGSPLLDAQGQVVGVITASRDDPRTKLPAIGLARLREFLAAHNAVPAAPCANPDPLGVFEVTVDEQ